MYNKTNQSKHSGGLGSIMQFCYTAIATTSWLLATAMYTSAATYDVSITSELVDSS